MDEKKQESGDEVYNANEWGHTILWLCILLLTACVVASGGVVAPPDAPANAAANAPAVSPTEPARVTETYTDGRLTLVLSAGANAEELTGVAKLGGKDYPVKAVAKADGIEGVFSSEGNVFPFTAIKRDNRLKFTTGQTNYDLKRETPAPAPVPASAPVPAPVPNPLVTQTTGAPSAPTPGLRYPEDPGLRNTSDTGVTEAVSPVVDPAPVAAPAPVRPTLLVQQGRYFRWSMPQGWQSNETTNGVDITAPDGRAGASSVLLVGAPGSSTPQRFVEQFMPQCGVRNLNFIAVKDLPDQSFAGYPMKITQMELTYDLNGTPFHGLITCAIINGWNQYTAFLQGAGAAPEQWDHMKTWLPAVATGVVITNPKLVALQDRIVLPKNRPLDDSSIMSSWEAKNRSEDRMSQKREETTLGYERMKDTNAGQMYDIPFERYDATRGGYVNPQRPTELLEHAAVGE